MRRLLLIVSFLLIPTLSQAAFQMEWTDQTTGVTYTSAYFRADIVTIDGPHKAATVQFGIYRDSIAANAEGRRPVGGMGFTLTGETFTDFYNAVVINQPLPTTSLYFWFKANRPEFSGATIVP